MAAQAGDEPGIRGLLLDFGGVVTCSLFEQTGLAEQRLGLPEGSLAWRGPIDPSTDALWRAMQRQEISEREYWATRARETGALLGEKWNVRTFFQRARSPNPNESIRPQAERTIRLARRAGLRVGILSNELELFYGKEFLVQVGILREVHCIVDATHTRILKPDPRAYELALRALDTEAPETLFVDDQLLNVQGAERAGLRAMFFDVSDPERCFKRLNALFAQRARAELRGPNRNGHKCHQGR